MADNSNAKNFQCLSKHCDGNCVQEILGDSAKCAPVEHGIARHITQNAAFRLDLEIRQATVVVRLPLLQRCARRGVHAIAIQYLAMQASLKLLKQHLALR